MTADQRPTHPVGEDDLQAHVDGRLDPARDAVVRAWLENHPAEAERIGAYVKQREALRLRLQTYHAQPVPARLQPGALRRNRRAALSRGFANTAAGLVLLLVGAAGGWLAHGSGPARLVPLLTADAASAHLTFVSEQRHPVEVTAAQEGHLVQWLSNRLGRPLRAPDLAAQGFRLMGGRLLPGATTPAAQFMYDDDRGTRLTVYMRADPGDATTGFRIVEQGGLSGLFWVDRGFGYAVLAQASHARLWPVAEAIWRQLGGTQPGAVPSASH